jgi:hypothetical protein
MQTCVLTATGLSIFLHEMLHIAIAMAARLCQQVLLEMSLGLRYSKHIRLGNARNSCVAMLLDADTLAHSSLIPSN